MTDNLTGVNYTINGARFAALFEPGSSPSIEEQAIGRIRRIGQKYETKSLRYLQKKSIDVAICNLQKVLGHADANLMQSKIMDTLGQEVKKAREGTAEPEDDDDDDDDEPNQGGAQGQQSDDSDEDEEDDMADDDPSAGDDEHDIAPVQAVTRNEDVTNEAFVRDIIARDEAILRYRSLSPWEDDIEGI